MQPNLIKYGKVVLVNLVIFVVLLLLVNWLCGKYINSTRVDRASLPNYEDKEYSKAVFRDYYSTVHRYEPFIAWKIRPYSGKTLNINEDGDRVVVPTNQNNDTIVRFFGGSTLWGEGSSDEHTIPSVFQRLNPDYTVYNHAQLAFNSRQNLSYLLNLYSQEKKADIVVFYDGVNDAAFLCPPEIPVPGHRHVPTFMEKLYGSKKQFILKILDRLFLSNINQAIMVYRKESGKEYKTHYTCYEDPDKIESIARGMIRNWEIAKELVEAEGGKFYAVLQPVSFVGNPRVDHMGERDMNLDKSMVLVYKRFKEIISERKYDWIFDLSDQFDGNEMIYIDFCHVSPNGNEIMGNAISKNISGHRQTISQ